MTSPNRREWHLITGEYPPSPGGVADYTASLAGALVDAGTGVRVWGPGDADGTAIEQGGVAVHRVAGRFGPSGLARLDDGIRRCAGPRKILVQYVPHSYGFKAMNLPFAAWIAWRARRGDDVQVMFHEVAFPWVRRPIRHNIVAAANRMMAALLIRSCSRAYVSIPGWVPILEGVGAGRVPITWTPIPSNIPGDPCPRRVAGRRDEVTGGSSAAPVVGHFGTYGPSVTRSLAPALRDLLGARADVRVVLLGAGGSGWRRELIGGRAEWSDRVVSPGLLPAPAIAEYLAACDLAIQPFPDGVSSRRTTVMAALANGVPVVTTVGALSEPLWADGSVAISPVGEPGRLAALAAELLDSPGRRAELGRAGRQLYEGRFALRHTVDTLLTPS